MSRTSSQQLRVEIELRDRILTGAFAPGDRLAEIPIGEMLGASRTPVRLALTHLLQEGLVIKVPTGGFAVRELAVSDISDGIEVRSSLEGLAARQAAERGFTPDVAQQFESLLEKGDKVFEGNRDFDSERLDEYARVNERIHALIVIASRNSALERALALNDNLPFAAANAFIASQTSVPNAHGILLFAHMQHRQIFEAISRRESVRAQELARQHALNAIDNIRSAALAMHPELGSKPSLLALLKNRKPVKANEQQSSHWP